MPSLLPYPAGGRLERSCEPTGPDWMLVEAELRRLDFEEASHAHTLRRVAGGGSMRIVPAGVACQ